MPLGDYLVGVIWFTLTVGPSAATTVVVRRVVLAHLSGSVAALACGLVFTAALAAATLVPGALGLLANGTVAVTALLVYIVVWRWAGRRAGARNTSEALASPASDRGSQLLAAATGATVAFYLLCLLAARSGHAITSIDALSFEIPGIVNWIQDGSVWPIHHYVPGWSFSAYPHNGELIELAAVLPWHSDAFLRPVSGGCLLLGGLATYVLARELGAGSAASFAWGAAVVATPAGLVTAFHQIKTDPMMLAWFCAGVTVLVRHLRTRARADLVLGALGLGLALGTKWYGLTYCAMALVIWLGAGALTRPPGERLRHEAGLAVGVVALAGGFWLLRNLVEFGNPVWPQEVQLLGVTPFDAAFDEPRATIGHTLLHYVGDWGVWRPIILPTWRDAFTLSGLLGMLAAVAAIGMFAVRRARGVDRRALAVALLALGLFAGYMVTPYTAQGPDGHPVYTAAGVRYAMPALALGCALAAVLTARLGRLQFLGVLAALAGVLDALQHVDDMSRSGALADIVTARRGALAAVVLLAAMAAIVVARRCPPPRATLGAAMALLAVGAVAAGRAHVQDYQAGRYRGADPTLDWVIAKAPAGHRIGVTGTPSAGQLWPIVPLAGPRFGNAVEPVGPVRWHMLRRLTRQQELAAELRRRRYDLLYVMRAQPATRAREEAWAQELGFRPVIRSERSTLLRRGP